MALLYCRRLRFGHLNKKVQKAFSDYTINRPVYSNGSTIVLWYTEGRISKLNTYYYSEKCHHQIQSTILRSTSRCQKRQLGKPETTVQSSTTCSLTRNVGNPGDSPVESQTWLVAVIPPCVSINEQISVDSFKKQTTRLVPEYTYRRVGIRPCGLDSEVDDTSELVAQRRESFLVNITGKGNE